MTKTWLYLAIGCAGLTAQTAQINRYNGPPKPDMDEQTLQQKYNIAPTEEGLIGALQHKESLVRTFAAIDLANKGDKAAIRPILDALAAETVDRVKVVQATSAARLGAAEGFGALKNMCEDQSWSPRMRMTAATSMVNIAGRQECLSDVIDVLRAAPDDHDTPIEALHLLPKFKQILANRLDEVRDLSASYLNSRDLGIRIAAGQCVRDLGGPWAISRLRAAIDAEQNEAVRNLLAKDLVSVRQ